MQYFAYTTYQSPLLHISSVSLLLICTQDAPKHIVELHICETFNMSQRKRKQIKIEEKSRIITKLESGISNRDLAKEYGVSHSTISTIWKERRKIQTLYDRNFLEMKRARTTKHTKIEEALLKWFKYQRTNNVPINGPILQQKANDFAQRFGEDFVCSSSWIQRFRARHGIAGGKMSAETASVDEGVVEEWMSQKWPTFYIKSTLPQLQVNCASAPDQSLKIPEGAVIIARVYKYLQKEYEELKARSGDAPALSSLSDILGRTAAATGLSQRAVSAVLEAGKRSHAEPEGREQKRAKYYFDEDGSALQEGASCEGRDNARTQDTCKTSAIVHNVLNSTHTELRIVPADGKNRQLDTNSSAHHVTDVSRVVKIELSDNQSETRVVGPCSRHETPDSTHAEVKLEPPDGDPHNSGQQDEDGYELRLKFEADEEHAIRTSHHTTPDRPHVEVKIEPPDDGIRMEI